MPNETTTQAPPARSLMDTAARMIMPKTKIEISVISTTRGMFHQAAQVASWPIDVERNELYQAFNMLSFALYEWLQRDQPRRCAEEEVINKIMAARVANSREEETAEMAAEIAVVGAAFARERERARPSDLLLHGDIEGRGFCLVRRYGAPGFAGGSWLCGYVDATGSRFDGIDDEDDPAFAGLGVEITYTGQGVPGCDGAPSTGWWIGFDTAHPGMEDETAESVEETIRGLVRAMGVEVRG